MSNMLTVVLAVRAGSYAARKARRTSAQTVLLKLLRCKTVNQSLADPRRELATKDRVLASVHPVATIARSTLSLHWRPVMVSLEGTPNHRGSLETSFLTSFAAGHLWQLPEGPSVRQHPWRSWRWFKLFRRGIITTKTLKKNLIVLL